MRGVDGSGRVQTSPTAAGESTSGRSVRRQALDQGRVVAGAIEFIELYGARQLTMRALGEHLGVQAMSLYRYVPSRERLLDAVVENVMDELFADPDLHTGSCAIQWQDYLRTLAHGIRRIALNYPHVFPLIVTRPPIAPWIRPPLRSLRWAESFLDTLVERGFTDADAVAAYRGYSSFLLGHLLLEVSALGVEVGPVPPDPTEPVAPSPVSVRDFPQVHRLRAQLAREQSVAEFDASLENLLARLEDGSRG